MKNETYQVVRLDESEFIPYDYLFKTDAVRMAMDLNKNDYTGTLAKSAWYVKVNSTMKIKSI